LNDWLEYLQLIKGQKMVYVKQNWFGKGQDFVIFVISSDAKIRALVLTLASPKKS